MNAKRLKEIRQHSHQFQNTDDAIDLRGLSNDIAYDDMPELLVYVDELLAKIDEFIHGESGDQ